MLECTLTSLGKKGFPEVAKQNILKTEYAGDRLTSIEGVDNKYEAASFNEFVITTPRKAEELLQELRKRRIIGGVDFQKVHNGEEGGYDILLTFTEKTKKEDIDALCREMASVLEVGLPDYNDAPDVAFDDIRFTTDIITDLPRADERSWPEKLAWHFDKKRTYPLAREQSRPGQRGYRLPKLDVPDDDDVMALIPEGLQRQAAARLPEVSMRQVKRHYRRLAMRTASLKDYAIFLGSCTMKFNAAIMQKVSSLPGFANLHPLMPTEYSQGMLAALYELQNQLRKLYGLEGVSLQPAAGAHGEFAGFKTWKKYLDENHVEGAPIRDVVVVPESAHGTNLASATMSGLRITTAGKKVVEIEADENGIITAEAYYKFVEQHATEEKWGDRLAGIAITNPNTFGLFETDIFELKKMTNEVGGLVYMDGANSNAFIGRYQVDQIADIIQLNIHKTFGTPHGGGGPGAGPVLVRGDLKKYLPGPIVEFDGNTRLYKLTNPDASVGRIHGFYGNVGVLLQGWAYIKLLGGQGLAKASGSAVLNSNYMFGDLMNFKDENEEPYYNVKQAPGVTRMHEFVLEPSKAMVAKGIDAMVVAKALMDQEVPGVKIKFHPGTTSFPEHLSIMIEPTESPTKEILDAYVTALKQIAVMASADDVTELLTAPHTTPVDSIDSNRAEVQQNTNSLTQTIPSLTQQELDNGAQFVPFAHARLPGSYRGLKNEMEAIFNSCGITDISHMARFRFKGKDALKFLEHLTPCKLPKENGVAGVVAFTNEAGGIKEDAYIMRVNKDEYMVICNSCNYAKMKVHFAREVGRFDVNITDEKANTAMIYVNGRLAQELLQNLTYFDLRRLGPKQFAEIKLAGEKVIISHTGYGPPWYEGHDGNFEIMATPEAMQKVFAELMPEDSAYQLKQAAFKIKYKVEDREAMDVYIKEKIAAVGISEDQYERINIGGENGEITEIIMPKPEVKGVKVTVKSDVKDKIKYALKTEIYKRTSDRLFAPWPGLFAKAAEEGKPVPDTEKPSKMYVLEGEDIISGLQALTSCDKDVTDANEKHPDRRWHPTTGLTPEELKTGMDLSNMEIGATQLITVQLDYTHAGRTLNRVVLLPIIRLTENQFGLMSKEDRYVAGLETVMEKALGSVPNDVSAGREIWRLSGGEAIKSLARHTKTSMRRRKGDPRFASSLYHTTTLAGESNIYLSESQFDAEEMESWQSPAWFTIKLEGRVIPVRRVAPNVFDLYLNPDDVALAETTLVPKTDIKFEIEDITAKRSSVLAKGPNVTTVLTKYVDKAVLSRFKAGNKVLLEEFDGEKLTEPVWVIVDKTKDNLETFEFYGLKNNVKRIREKLIQHVEFRQLYGLTTRDELRKIAGLPLYGHQMREDESTTVPGSHYRDMIDKDRLNEDANAIIGGANIKHEIEEVTEKKEAIKQMVQKCNDEMTEIEIEIAKLKEKWKGRREITAQEYRKLTEPLNTKFAGLKKRIAAFDETKPEEVEKEYAIAFRVLPDTDGKLPPIPKHGYKICVKGMPNIIIGEVTDGVKIDPIPADISDAQLGVAGMGFVNHPLYAEENTEFSIIVPAEKPGEKDRLINARIWPLNTSFYTTTTKKQEEPAPPASLAPLLIDNQTLGASVLRSIPLILGAIFTGAFAFAGVDGESTTVAQKISAIGLPMLFGVLGWIAIKIFGERPQGIPEIDIEMPLMLDADEIGRCERAIAYIIPILGRILKKEKEASGSLTAESIKQKLTKFYWQRREEAARAARRTWLEKGTLEKDILAVVIESLVGSAENWDEELVIRSDNILINIGSEAMCLGGGTKKNLTGRSDIVLAVLETFNIGEPGFRRVVGFEERRRPAPGASATARVARLVKSDEIPAELAEFNQRLANLLKHAFEYGNFDEAALGRFTWQNQDGFEIETQNLTALELPFGVTLELPRGCRKIKILTASLAENKIRLLFVNAIGKQVMFERFDITVETDEAGQTRLYAKDKGLGGRQTVTEIAGEPISVAPKRRSRRRKPAPKALPAPKPAPKALPAPEPAPAQETPTDIFSRLINEYIDAVHREPAARDLTDAMREIYTTFSTGLLIRTALAVSSVAMIPTADFQEIWKSCRERGLEEVMLKPVLTSCLVLEIGTLERQKLYTVRMGFHDEELDVTVEEHATPATPGVTAEVLAP